MMLNGVKVLSFTHFRKAPPPSRSWPTSVPTS